jgi:hypothetical protein
MAKDSYTKVVLTLITFLLLGIILRPALHPDLVQAQTTPPHLYVEPGVLLLRKPDGTAQLKGKMVIDLRSGEIWGFPTLSDVPYPVAPVETTPPVSKPMYLGKFDFSEIRHSH